MKAMASELNMYQAQINESNSNPNPRPNPHPNPHPNPNPNLRKPSSPRLVRMREMRRKLCEEL